MLELIEVKKQYHLHKVLEPTTLHLDTGIYWIKGANSSGKTTLLKMIAGLLPFEGDIRLKGVSICRQPTLYRKQVGWSEAEPLYPSFLTGKDLLRFYMQVRGASQKDIQPLLERLGVDHYYESSIGTYSAGMIKKLSLLLAFVGNPSCILLDEPLITLDDLSLAQVKQMIVETCKLQGTGFLISSHQPLHNELLVPGGILQILNHSIVWA